MAFTIRRGVLVKYIEEPGETEVVIPDNVTAIGDEAFYQCKKLVSVTIPESVTSIGDLAFSRCESLTSIAIPESVTSIGDWAFHECKSLTSITYPECVAVCASPCVFTFCPNISVIKLHPDDPELRRKFDTFEHKNLDWSLSHASEYATTRYMDDIYRRLFAILFYLRTHDETSCAYIREHLFDILEESIRFGDTVFIADITRNAGWVNATRICTFLSYAQKYKEPEIFNLLLNWITADLIDECLEIELKSKNHDFFLCLLNYKREKLGFADPGSDLVL